ncbi:hypothetical protein [Pseudooceanicola sp. 200-1SW]|uniref:hypothetical protein n=1 Tax=Pseudooceanicola sp. 200-1SW TaxID=3425949 RepID=UPI003D7F88D7
MALTRVPSFDGSGVTFVTSSLDLTSGTVYDVTTADLKTFDLDYDNDNWHDSDETVVVDGVETTVVKIYAVDVELTLSDGSVINWDAYGYPENARVLELANGQYLWYLVRVPSEYTDVIVESIEVQSSVLLGGDYLGGYTRLPSTRVTASSKAPKALTLSMRLTTGTRMRILSITMTIPRQGLMPVASKARTMT